LLRLLDFKALCESQLRLPRGAKLLGNAHPCFQIVNQPIC
jgi:hypothetical protein